MAAAVSSGVPVLVSICSVMLRGASGRIRSARRGRGFARRAAAEAFLPIAPAGGPVSRLGGTTN